MNSSLLLEQVSIKEFICDVKSMLLGIESNSFEYGCVVCVFINFNVKQQKIFKKNSFFKLFINNFLDRIYLTKKH